MDIDMATSAEHKGLALASGHELNPHGFVPTSGLVEVGEMPDVVNLQIRAGLAELAALGQEPTDQLVVGGCSDRPDIVELDSALSFEGDPAEAGDQRLLPLAAFDRDLKTAAWPVSTPRVYDRDRSEFVDGEPLFLRQKSAYMPPVGPNATIRDDLCHFDEGAPCPPCPDGAVGRVDGGDQYGGAAPSAYPLDGAAVVFMFPGRDPDPGLPLLAWGACGFFQGKTAPASA